MAEASEQPVPWVLVVAMRGASQRRDFLAVDDEAIGKSVAFAMAALDEEGAH